MSDDGKDLDDELAKCLMATLVKKGKNSILYIYISEFYHKSDLSGENELY